MKTPILKEAVKGVYRRLEEVRGDPGKLPTPLQAVAILYCVQAIIDNGGFRYLFESQFPIQPPYTTYSWCYRQIGCEEVADRIDEASAMFPFPDPEQKPIERNTFMETLPEDSELFALGDPVCGDDRIWQRMEEYVNDNRGAFDEILFDS